MSNPDAFIEADWHGWSRGTSQDAARKAGTLHVGPLPGRRGIALYIEQEHEPNGCTITPLAYFRDEAGARRYMEVMDWLMLGQPMQEVQE